MGARCMKFGMETDVCGVPSITSKSTVASMAMQKFEVVGDEFNVDRSYTSVISASQSSSNNSRNNSNDDDSVINNAGSLRRNCFLDIIGTVCHLVIYMQSNKINTYYSTRPTITS